MILGSHLSIAGGLHRAVESASRYGFDALAMFVRNQRQWSAKPLAGEDIEQFHAARKMHPLKAIAAHAIYLANLASDNPDTREKSIIAVADDLSRCDALGIEYLVLHPGSAKDAEKGVQRIAEGVKAAFDESQAAHVRLLLETMAGQGNCIGHRFEQLAELLEKIGNPQQTGICLDTAHIFTAGYDLRTSEAARHTLREFDHVIGMKKLHIIHCNDSMKPFDSHVDRHAHIGEGEIGLEGFRALVRSRKLKHIPFILETPKGEDEKGRNFDRLNAKILQDMAK